MRKKTIGKNIKKNDQTKINETMNDYNTYNFTSHKYLVRIYALNVTLLQR